MINCIINRWNCSSEWNILVGHGFKNCDRISRIYDQMELIDVIDQNVIQNTYMAVRCFLCCALHEFLIISWNTMQYNLLNTHYSFTFDFSEIFDFDNILLLVRNKNKPIKKNVQEDLANLTCYFKCVYKNIVQLLLYFLSRNRQH